MMLTGKSKVDDRVAGSWLKIAGKPFTADDIPVRSRALLRRKKRGVAQVHDWGFVFHFPGKRRRNEPKCRKCLT